MIRANHFKVIVKFNDGTETMEYEYPTSKIAEGIARRYLKASCVESVEIEEI